MDETQAMEHLLLILEDRFIPLTKDDIQWAFESAKTKKDAVAWVEEYLHSDSLLTKDELEIYRQIPRSVSRRKSVSKPTSVRPIHDEEVQIALQSLEQSTKAIEKQCEELRVQKEAIIALRSQGETSSSISRALDDRQRRNAQEKGQLDITVDEVVESIKEQVSTMEKQIKAATSSLSVFASDRLSSDDRDLAALSKLTPQVQDTTSHEGPDLQSINKWSQALIAFRSADVRSRIDRIYLEGLTAADKANPPPRSGEEATAELQALKGELETLYSEIASVAEMTVNHDLRDPILQAMKDSDAIRLGTQRAWLKYVSSTLDYMAKRLGVVQTYTNDLCAFRCAFSEIRGPLDEELKSAPRNSAATPSKYPTHSRTPSKSSKTAESPVLDDATKVIQQFLRRLEVSQNFSTISEGRKVLSQTISERQRRLRELYTSDEDFMIQVLAETLGRSDSEVHSLVEALHAFTEYRTIKLSNENLDTRAKDLEATIGDMSAKIATVNLAVEDSNGRKADRLIDRWGNNKAASQIS